MERRQMRLQRCTKKWTRGLEAIASSVTSLFEHAYASLEVLINLAWMLEANAGFVARL